MAANANFYKNLGRTILTFVVNIPKWLYNRMLAVPVRIKVVGIGLLPILILGFTLNYWMTTGLSDWLSYILSDVRVQAAMEAGERSVTLVTFLSGIISIFFSLVLSYILSHPISSLKEMAQQVANGDLTARAQVWANDEIGELAVAINTMTDRLVTAQEDLARKNRSLDAINQVALAGNRQDEIHDVLYGILKNIIGVMHLKVGWIYLRDPEKENFHLASWHGIEKDNVPHFQGILQESGCTCQRELISKTTYPAEIQECERLLRLDGFNIEKNHITIPLRAREQHLGIINLLCEKDSVVTSEDMELLTSIGSQVSEIVSNAWLHLKLVEKEAARQVLLKSLVEAQEEERRRLARELHDGAGQTLTGLLVRLKIIENKSPLPQTQKDLQIMEGLVSDTIEQIRTLAHQLRPAALEEFGLPLALDSLVQDMSRHDGLQADCSCNIKNNEISDEVESVLYRIAQEGLTNIVRHSHAAHLSLTVDRSSQGVIMTIEDDGVGFDPSALGVGDGKKHLGLISMRERAEILGGTLDVYTAPDMGTTIQVTIPVDDM
ncbi:MAG: HAMP domain-containing protein [Anaerolineales bacterium]|nr:HAMP domain-containing protein [Anaerolineales bacterium]